MCAQILVGGARLVKRQVTPRCGPARVDGFPFNGGTKRSSPVGMRVWLAPMNRNLARAFNRVGVVNGIEYRCAFQDSVKLSKLADHVECPQLWLGADAAIIEIGATLRTSNAPMSTSGMERTVRMGVGQQSVLS